MPREIVYNENIRRRMQSGVDKLANAVKTTLGPRGRNVVIQRPSGSPLVTNDGATIAKEIELEDYVENMGARLIKEVTLKTYNVAGDGTTTATVLAQYIIREGFKNIASGANTLELIKGIQGATQLAVAAIRKLAKPVETREAIAQVAAVSAEDTDIGEMIAEAMEKVGMDGVITVDESESRDTTLNVKEGMQYEGGYLSPEMVTDKKKMVAELDSPYILITDRKISDPQELVPLLDQIAKQGKPMLIIAEGVEGEALGMLVMNKKNGVLNAVAVRPPAYGDGRSARMDDLAILTGGTFITKDMGYVLQETTLDMLGSAISVRVEKQNTVIIGGAGDKKAVATRIRYLRMLIEKAEYDFDRKQLEERLAKLVSGVAIIKVGAATEIEMKEKKQRIENARNAAKAAVAEGIVPGGGVAYINTIPAIKAYIETLSGDMKTGAAIILKALVEPARQIAENAGLEGSSVIAEVKQRPAGVGFNAVTKEYTNMMEAGIVDSAKVVRLALQYAASLSAVLMTVEVGVTDTKK
jgi:chaperonin GroEL